MNDKDLIINNNNIVNFERTIMVKQLQVFETWVKRTSNYCVLTGVSPKIFFKIIDCIKVHCFSSDYREIFRGSSIYFELSRVSNYQRFELSEYGSAVHLIWYQKPSLMLISEHSFKTKSYSKKKKKNKNKIHIIKNQNLVLFKTLNTITYGLTDIPY